MVVASVVHLLLLHMMRHRLRSVLLVLEASLVIPATPTSHSSWHHVLTYTSASGLLLLHLVVLSLSHLRRVSLHRDERTRVEGLLVLRLVLLVTEVLVGLI